MAGFGKLSCGSGSVVLSSVTVRGGVGGGTVHAMVFHRWPPRGPAVSGRRRPGGSLPRVAIPTPVQWLIKPRTCVIKRLLTDPPPWHYADKHTQTNKQTTHKRARADSANRFMLVYDNNIYYYRLLVCPEQCHCKSSHRRGPTCRNGLPPLPVPSIWLPFLFPICTAEKVNTHCVILIVRGDLVFFFYRVCSTSTTVLPEKCPSLTRSYFTMCYMVTWGFSTNKL